MADGSDGRTSVSDLTSNNFGVAAEDIDVELWIEVFL
jgi:hypothetical protein